MCQSLHLHAIEGHALNRHDPTAIMPNFIGKLGEFYSIEVYSKTSNLVIDRESADVMAKIIV